MFHNRFNQLVHIYIRIEVSTI